MKSRIALVSGGLFPALFLFGCTDKGSPPEEQYEQVMARVREGELTAAYQACLPPSYEQEADELLAKVGQLVDKEDYEMLRQALSSGGAKIAGFIAFTGADDPMVKLLTDKLKDIPKVLGIDSYERFRKLSLASLVGAVEENLFRDMLKLEDVRKRIESVRFELKERRNDWARLVVTFQPPDGDAVTDRMDLIRHEGRWVPGAWVTDWPALMKSWREQIEETMKLKTETPDAFKKSLAAIREAAENPAALLQRLPELGKQLGLAESE